ncbi:hypothetical protein TPA0906_33790 [Streptomyces olivaceus]|nr:hypothetical protein TPA0906_33790 [Streptomyces olivaceus]
MEQREYVQQAGRGRHVVDDEEDAPAARTGDPPVRVLAHRYAQPRRPACHSGPPPDVIEIESADPAAPPDAIGAHPAEPGRLDCRRAAILASSEVVFDLGASEV